MADKWPYIATESLLDSIRFLHPGDAGMISDLHDKMTELAEQGFFQ